MVQVTPLLAGMLRVSFFDSLMIRLSVLAILAATYSFCVSGGVINGTTAASYAAGGGPPFFAMLWIREDAKTSGFWPAYHYGMFLWVFWPVLAPHYFLRTRGRRGLGTALFVSAILWLPVVSAMAGAYFYYDLPDFR